MYAKSEMYICPHKSNGSCGSRIKATNGGFIKKNTLTSKPMDEEHRIWNVQNSVWVLLSLSFLIFFHIYEIGIEKIECSKKIRWNSNRKAKSFKSIEKSEVSAATAYVVHTESAVDIQVELV